MYIADNFDFCAMLFCTINDYPAYNHLYGYNVKGHKVFPICEVDTRHHQLPKGKIQFILGIKDF